MSCFSFASTAITALQVQSNYNQKYLYNKPVPSKQSVFFFFEKHCKRRYLDLP